MCLWLILGAAGDASSALPGFSHRAYYTDDDGRKQRGMDMDDSCYNYAVSDGCSPIQQHIDGIGVSHDSNISYHALRALNLQDADEEDVDIQPVITSSHAIYRASRLSAVMFCADVMTRDPYD